MAITTSYPGVYIEEVPSGVRPIEGVATSITAFLGRTLRGPIDAPGTAKSWADFERVHGGLWKASTLGYAVQHFFNNGGVLYQYIGNCRKIRSWFSRKTCSAATSIFQSGYSR